MNIARLKAFGMSCAFFMFIVFSVSAGASDMERFLPDPGIELFESADGRVLPVFDFQNAQLPESTLDDIQVENFTVNDDGSVRFQLTHRGPMSRQAFAHVKRIEQDDGYTRSIITNIADGQQMEFLSLTADEPVRALVKDKSADDWSLQIEEQSDVEVVCPVCVHAFVFAFTEAMCVGSTLLAYDLCKTTCRYLGGVSVFKTGICGLYNSECHCMVDPRRVNDEFGLGG